MNKKAIYLAALAGVILWAGPSKAEDPKSAEPAGHDRSTPAGGVKEFTAVGIEYQGSKLWLPSTFIVKVGQKVRIKLVNNIKSDPNTHGFAIDEYGIKKVVARGVPETVEFTADKEGLFTVYCHQHPAHIGGQLLVIR